ncbi:MAG: ABC transporter permease subunit [Acidobacteria bacterium]|nr:ABC transporter permease subunit [Acidobacteriota bacterium]
MIPVITMRLISEERRSGTIEPLLTSPITEGQVIAGKFVAALVFYVILWLPTIIYVLILKHYTAIDLGPVASGYLGVLLLGVLFLGVGIFTSTLAKNQLIAAVFAFAAMVILFSIGLIQQLLVSSSALRGILGYMNLWTQMDDFARGIVDTRHIVYQLSVGLMFLYFATKSLEVKKWR